MFGMSVADTIRIILMGIFILISIVIIAIIIAIITLTLFKVSIKDFIDTLNDPAAWM